jgi:hypothetical protein
MALAKQLNLYIENIVRNLCEKLGYEYNHYITTTSKNKRFHMYVILNPKLSNSKTKTVKSKNCIYYKQVEIIDNNIKHKSENACFRMMVKFLKYQLNPTVDPFENGIF